MASNDAPLDSPNSPLEASPAVVHLPELKTEEDTVPRRDLPANSSIDFNEDQEHEAVVADLEKRVSNADTVVSLTPAAGLKPSKKQAHKRSQSRELPPVGSKTPTAAMLMDRPKRHSIMATLSATAGNYGNHINSGNTSAPVSLSNAALVSKEERIKFVNSLTKQVNLGSTMTRALNDVVNADIPVELLTPVEDLPVLHSQDFDSKQEVLNRSTKLSPIISNTTSRVDSKMESSDSSAVLSQSANSPDNLDRENYVAISDKIVSKFNEDPEKGQEALAESKLVDIQDVKQVADFLFASFGLDPDALGKYLGKKSRQAILEAYVLKNDFRGMSIADAVRHMLRKFKPQGENAIIDRVVTAFAAAWVRDNPDVFSHPDTPYQLAFATLMVNTSLHNPHAMDRAPPLVKSVSSFQRVIKKELCRDEKKLDNAYLEDLYNSIRQRPIELVMDKYMTIFRDSVRSGWVEKKTKQSLTQWKRRLLVLSGHSFIGFALYYFKAGRDRAWRMMIPLNSTIQCGIQPNDPCTFYVQRTDKAIMSAAKRNDEGITERHERNKFLFRCADEREAQIWIEAIEECLRLHSGAALIPESSNPIMNSTIATPPSKTAVDTPSVDKTMKKINSAPQVN